MYNFLIRKSKAKEFIKESNKNVIIEEFKEECKEASEVFQRDEVHIGVSMGIILPMEDEVAKEFLEISKTASISKESYEKCLELSKDIIKR